MKRHKNSGQLYARGIVPAAKLQKVQRAALLTAPAPAAFQARGERGGRKFAHLYKTRRWFKLRAQILKRDMYTCQLCGAAGAAAGKLVCDHVRGHPEDETEEMFWAGPFQCVCFGCHNTIRAREDNARRNGCS